MHGIITFLTDFGEGSPYVAQMKAAVLTLNPAATLVDITHSIPAQDVRHAAIVWDEVAPRFPAETIHVCVVDPGVGTSRKVLYAQLGPHHYLAPDNGVLSRVAQHCVCTRQCAVEARQYFRHPVSATFHGRDILAPVAAHLSLGLSPDQLGPPVPARVELVWPEVVRRERSLEGVVELVDRFGNLITNIPRSAWPTDVAPRDLQVSCGDRQCDMVVDTYGHAPPHALVALVGSSDRLEIAVTNGHAAEHLAVQAGAEVRVTW